MSAGDHYIDALGREVTGADNFEPATYHGFPQPVPVEALLADDPDLWLATADMRAWSAAHPCACEAICVCEGE